MSRHGEVAESMPVWRQVDSPSCNDALMCRVAWRFPSKANDCTANSLEKCICIHNVAVDEIQPRFRCLSSAIADSNREQAPFTRTMLECAQCAVGLAT